MKNYEMSEDQILENQYNTNIMYNDNLKDSRRKNIDSKKRHKPDKYNKYQ